MAVDITKIFKKHGEKGLVSFYRQNGLKVIPHFPIKHVRYILPAILKDHGYDIAEDHKKAAEKDEMLLNYDAALDNIVSVLSKKINTPFKKKKSAFGMPSAKNDNSEDIALKFVYDIAQQERAAVRPSNDDIDFIVLAVNAKNPFAEYKNDGSKIFDLFDRVKKPLARVNPNDLVQGMDMMLEDNILYKDDKELKFRQPRLKGTADINGLKVNIFYTSLKKQGYPFLFDHSATLSYLNKTGYALAGYTTKKK